jgi:uncharacterized CHY-type Zn-finger protein
MKPTIPLLLKYQKEELRKKKEICGICRKNRALFVGYVCKKCWKKSQPNLFAIK